MPRRMSAERIALRQLAYELYVTMPKLSIRMLSRMLLLDHPVVMRWRRLGAWQKLRKRYWSSELCHLAVMQLQLVTCLVSGSAHEVANVVHGDGSSGGNGATVHVAQSFADRAVNYARLVRWLGCNRGRWLGALHEEPKPPRIDRSSARYYSKRAPANKKPRL